MTHPYFYTPSDTNTEYVNDVLSTICVDNKLHLCVYRVTNNDLLKAPVLSFFLTKKQNKYEFPSFMTKSNDRLSSDYLGSYLKSLVNIHELQLINAYKRNDDIYVLFKTDKNTETTVTFNEFFMSEILNYDNSNETNKYNIAENVSLLFCQNPTLSYLYNIDRLPYEIPIVAFKTGRKNLNNYLLYSNGIIMDDRDSFYKYSLILNEEKHNSNIYKYLLFIGTYKIIRNNLSICAEEIETTFNNGFDSIICNNNLYVQNKLRQYFLSIVSE